MIDWSKKVVTTRGDEVVLLDKEFASVWGKGILFKISVGKHLSSSGHNHLGLYFSDLDAVYDLSTGGQQPYSLRNAPTKIEGWIAIYPSSFNYYTLRDDACLRRCSSVWGDVGVLTKHIRHRYGDEVAKKFSFQRVVITEP